MNNMIGQRIKERRKELNITQTQIQEQTGITSGNLSCIENGKYLPSSIALLELSKILNCSVDWILTGESAISNNTSFLDIKDSKELELVNYFREMSSDDQDELIQIAQIKATKKKRREEKLASSESNNIAYETA